MLPALLYGFCRPGGAFRDVLFKVRGLSLLEVVRYGAVKAVADRTQLSIVKLYK